MTVNLSKPRLLYLFATLCLMGLLLTQGQLFAAARRLDKRPSRKKPPPPSIIDSSLRRSVRFDAGYYYNGMSAPQLAEALADQWASRGVNDVYFYAYSYVYGARYYTTYPENVMEPWGEQDLLGYMLDSCHRRGIRVIAWLFAPIHKQVWDHHPDWREKDGHGLDYLPSWLPYRLCVVHPDFRNWWAGFIQDLLDRYPSLDGIDIAEPGIAEWGDTACYNPVDVATFRQFYPGLPYPSPQWRVYRGDTLTDFLRETAYLCHRAGKEFHITQVLTAWGDGSLISSAELRDAIGFDLDGILNDPIARPDIFGAELIWQQWLAVYGDARIFNSSWTTWATQQAAARLAGRALLVSHIELVDFGAGGLNAAEIAQTAQAALAAQPSGLDVYDTALLDNTPSAWDYLSSAWAY